MLTHCMAPQLLTATSSTCYSASFSLPATLPPGSYHVAVRNTLPNATFQVLGVADPTQAVLTVRAVPAVPMTGTTVECCNVD